MSTYNRALDRDENGRPKRTYRRPPFPMSTPGYWVRDHMNRPRRRQNRRSPTAHREAETAKAHRG